MKTVLLLLMALHLFAQNPSNQDLDILGHFNMAAGTYSAPFIPVGSDPTGACTTAGAVVMNTATGQLTGCIALIWTPLGGAGSGNVSGPGSSTNFALAAWNGTTGLVLRNTSVITDGSGNLTANSLTTSGGGAGTIGLSQGTVQGSFPANSVSLYAPATISSAYQWKLPAADSAGVVASDGAGTPGTLSILSVPSCLDSGGNHLNYNTSTHVFSCGTTGGVAGSAAFNTITSGTNTTATMTLGTGGSLTFSGSGTINANLISGSSPAASATTDTTNASNISSGTLGAGRLPNPTASTLGGVESLASISHNFLTSISTSGVPAQAQPAFSDLSGSATAGQIPAALSSTTSVNGTTIPSSSTLTKTIASGAKALGTSAISSGACATVATDTATGTLTTDVLSASFNGDPTAVTGYIPSTSGMLTIIVYPTADTANFKVCNNSTSSITPGAITLNWRVTR